MGGDPKHQMLAISFFGAVCRNHHANLRIVLREQGITRITKVLEQSSKLDKHPKAELRKQGLEVLKGALESPLRDEVVDAMQGNSRNNPGIRMALTILKEEDKEDVQMVSICTLVALLRDVSSVDSFYRNHGIEMVVGVLRDRIGNLEMAVACLKVLSKEANE